MDIAQILKQSGAIGNIAKQLGVNEQVAEMGANALLPSILGGFKKTTQQQSSGLEGLAGVLGGLGGGGLLESVLGPKPTPVDQGNNILGEIFGSKDVSRNVAGHASDSTGLDSSLLKKMLPLLAMVVAGYLSNRQSGGQEDGGLGGLLGGLLGGGASASSSQSTLGGIGSMLDLDGDGNPLDDIIGMAGKFLK